ncbi:MAG TPA: ATP-binding protein [Actinoplanes sp.]|nr:ATP-binding protein [Actinoplanes sp.]
MKRHEGAPYLVVTVTDRRGVSVDVVADASSTVVEIKVHGHWSQQLGEKITAGLGLCLAGPAEAIIIDLRDLSDLHGLSLRYWLAAQRTVRGGVLPVGLALCLPPATMLGYRLRNHDGNPVPLFATMGEARAAVAGRLRRSHRWQTRLAPVPVSVRAARDLVELACHTWQLHDLRQDAALVMSELAANAVEHAGTDFVLTVLRRGRDLHLAVRDGDTRYPRLVEPTREGSRFPIAEGGRGLILVHAVAARWGAIPAHGGKVVWATVSA